MRLLERLMQRLATWATRCVDCGHNAPAEGCLCPDGRCYCRNCETAGGDCRCQLPERV